MLQDSPQLFALIFLLDQQHFWHMMPSPHWFSGTSWWMGVTKAATRIECNQCNSGIKHNLLEFTDMLKLLAKWHFNIHDQIKLITNNHLYSSYKHWQHWETMRIMTNVRIETMTCRTQIIWKLSYTKYLYLLTCGPCISIFLQAIIDERAELWWISIFWWSWWWIIQYLNYKASS